jgi:hypothetical protein
MMDNRVCCQSTEITEKEVGKEEIHEIRPVILASDEDLSIKPHEIHNNIIIKMLSLSNVCGGLSVHR